MYRSKRTILAALNYSPDGTGGDGAAGGQGAGQGQQAGASATGGQQQLPAGVAPGSAAAQAFQGQQQATDNSNQGQQQSAGMVPVGELAQERQKRQALEAKVNELTAAQNQQMEAFKKALGLSDGQTPEQLQAAATAAQQQVRDANAQLAVTKLAKDAGGDAGALLDSASFLAKLKTLDPEKPEEITQAIKDAVAANKNLALARVAPAGSSDAGRVGGDGAPQANINDLLRATRS